MSPKRPHLHATGRVLVIPTALCLILAGCQPPAEEGAPTAPPSEPVPEVTGTEPPPKDQWKITASETQDEEFAARNACDGDIKTRWSSPASDPQWLRVDFGRPATVCGVTILWETAYARHYSIETSMDGEQWNTAFKTEQANGRTDEIYFEPVEARFVRMVGTKRGTGWGHSIWEMNIKGPSEQLKVQAPTAPGSRNAWLFDGQLDHTWQSAVHAPFTMEMDLQKVKAIGGLRIDWGANHATDLKMLASSDGSTWEQLSDVVEGTGQFDVLMHPKKDLRYIRLELQAAAQDASIGIKEISLRGPDEEVTPLLLFELAAEKAPVGMYLEYLHKRQAYWTIVGLPNDRSESLLDEYGNLEPKFATPCLMPYVATDGELYSALDAEKISQSLREKHLPLPSVTWDAGPLELHIQAMARGTVSDSVTYVRYQLTNPSDKPQAGRLYLAIRPAEVNPPWQYGGPQEIKSIEYHTLPEGQTVRINGEDVYISLTPPDDFGAHAFHRGDILEELRRGRLPDVKKLDNAGDWLSGALAYDFELAPGQQKNVVVATPLHESTVDIRSFPSTGTGEMLSPEEAFDRHLKAMRDFWRSKLDRVRIELPDQHVIDTMKAQVAYILINRDGVAIQPGSRNYKRCWIRDGSLTAAALLRMGLNQEVHDYLEWYSARVRPNGWVPPILHNNGELDQGFGWDNEFDSQGEYVFIMMEYYRFTKDRDFITRHFDKIHGALKYLVELRNRTLQPDHMKDEPARERFVGILPKSISHEGYSPPMHSYWDDFWALKGWKDGAEAARLVGREGVAAWADEQYEIFRSSLLASIKKTMSFKNVDYIPGCAEKGDFDATSTAIAIFPCGEKDMLPQDALRNTFERYYTDLAKRFDPNWVGGFTPYEIRSIAAFVALDENEKAKKLLDYMLSCRRPLAWNHLGEVVYSDPRMGSYIGDMPHTWVGSGYVNSVRGMLATEVDGRLVLLQGIPKTWVDEGDGILIRNLPTHFGTLNLTAKLEGDALTVDLSGQLDAPAGLELYWPVKQKPSRVLVDGQEHTDYGDRSVRLSSAARNVVVQW